jgi:hypothetical protein
MESCNWAEEDPPAPTIHEEVTCGAVAGFTVVWKLRVELNPPTPLSVALITIGYAAPD